MNQPSILDDALASKPQFQLSKSTIALLEQCGLYLSRRGTVPKISTLAESYPTDCEVLLHLRSQYADRVYFINKEYICYYLGKNDKPFEHRLVAEMVYGAIPDGYHVHHTNRKRFDNRAENLELLSPEDHAALHHGDSVVIQCAGCNEVIEVPWNRMVRSNQVFCSRRCRGAAQRKAKRPTKRHLSSLLLDLANYSAIGRMYGVSDNAVRKWCKQYGLPHRITDWKG